MNRLAELRNKRNINQIDMAKLLNVSQGTLSNWERGVHDIDQKTLKFLAEYFEVSIDYLLGQSDKSNWATDGFEVKNITEKEKKLFDLYQKAKNSDNPRDNAIADAVEKLLGMDE